MFICIYCEKICKNGNSLRNHSRLCKANPERQQSTFEKKQPVKRSNQYLRAKELGIDSYGHQSDEAKTRIAKVNSERGQSIEARQKLSKIAKENGLGGHTSKQKLYFKKNNGEIVYLQSSYEIKFATLLEEQNIDWCRPNPLLWVDSDGNEHRYYPDFKVGDKYFDTKNDYLAVVDAEKIKRVGEQNKVEIKIVKYNQINVEFLKSIM